ncbi:glycosyltransferase [Dokdonia ponticola]|uniref:Glycosyltransferase n=1 Tax=Dokdonia ponticola TaxID=2041041 RepID=A0ABV9HT24_9FLAO
MKKIKIDFLAQPTIGMNQSGMKSQLDNLYTHFENDDLLHIHKYNIWEKSSPDIVHYFGMGEGMLQVLKKQKSNGAKIICSPNHWPVDSKVEKLLMKINYKNVIYTNRVTKKFLIDHADSFIVNSESEKKMFSDNLNIEGDRIKVIHNSYGLEKEEIAFGDFRKKYTISKPYALMVGQVGSERKNQKPVLECWQADYDDLYILGGFDNTSYGQKCKRIIDSKSNIHYLGFESNVSILEDAYRNCNLLISPGLIETPSLSAFRALINGAKVCSTDFGGAPREYFGDNVFYFDPYNAKEIARVIAEAIKIKDMKIKFGEFDRFSNTNINKLYKEHYKEILKG